MLKGQTGRATVCPINERFLGKVVSRYSSLPRRTVWRRPWMTTWEVVRNQNQEQKENYKRSSMLKLCKVLVWLVRFISHPNRRQRGALSYEVDLKLGMAWPCSPVVLVRTRSDLPSSTVLLKVIAFFFITLGISRRHWYFLVGFWYTHAGVEI